MRDLLFWDCATQTDLADLNGSLYVPGTAGIRPRLARLVAAARAKKIPRLCTQVSHVEGDPDLTTEKPDFKTTYPAHCMAGTPGQVAIPETKCERPVELPRDDRDEHRIGEALRVFHEEVAIEVPGFDPWVHPAVVQFIEIVKPARVAVFGVPADKMVAAVIDGLLERGIAVTLVEDACKPFNVANWQLACAGWTEKGVTFATHKDFA